MSKLGDNILGKQSLVLRRDKIFPIMFLTLFKKQWRTVELALLEIKKGYQKLPLKGPWIGDKHCRTQLGRQKMLATS